MKSDPKKKNHSKGSNKEFDAEEELDLSYLSKWQTSLIDEYDRRDHSMSYDKDILNQRSDPTLNQINSEYSLAKLFYPSADNLAEEEKHINTEFDAFSNKIELGESSEVTKLLKAKINDLENTSRANKAMLVNALKRKQEPNKKIYDNCIRLKNLLKTQNDFINETGNMSMSTESSQDEAEYEDSKINDSRSRSVKSPMKSQLLNIDTQTDPKPVSFPFGSQTNFPQPNEAKIIELQNLLIKQEEEFAIKLEEAKKMEDVEDAFQAFLDQLDLNENEERIIIDGESRVWKIIRCSKSIIEDE